MKKRDLLIIFDDVLLDKLFGFCYARTNDSYEAEELCSDIVYALVKAAHSDGEIESIYPFIWRVARNVYADFSNNRRKRTETIYEGNFEDLLLGLAEDDPMLQVLGGINEMIITLAQFGAMLPIVSYVLLIPVGVFGLLAFFVVLRIILRLFNRRGLGLGITFLAAFNGAFMMGLPIVITEIAGAELPFGLETTNVPYIMVGCALVNCIIWAIGRGAKAKKVKEEVVAETPVAPAPVAAPVEPEVAVAVEDVVVEEPVDEETTEETEDEVVIDTELIEEVVEEENV